MDYDTPHIKPWGLDMAIYLLTKGIATGTMLLSALLMFFYNDHSPLTTFVGPAISLVFLMITTILLVADLERPERFYYILAAPELAIVAGLGRILPDRTGRDHGDLDRRRLVRPLQRVDWLAWPAVVVSLLTTGYTGFLFAQGLARDLWQGPSVDDRPGGAGGCGRRRGAAPGGTRTGRRRRAPHERAGVRPGRRHGRPPRASGVREPAMKSPTRHHELAV